MTIAVLGAGSWGTALAIHLARVGHLVRLWARDPSLAREMAERRLNAAYLPDVALPLQITTTAVLADALAGAAIVVSAVPSHGTRTVLRAAAAHVDPRATIVSGTKGLEVESLLRMSEVIASEMSGRPVVVLSGPSFAIEVARGLPTAVVAASAAAEAARQVQAEFRSGYFRLYGSGDVVGVEIGGALKNVIAIAAGVVEGLGLGYNARAALITRGLAEISRLGCALGARRETLAGLSGLGDLVLTCTSALSRNQRLGVELGHGRRLEDVLASTRMVAEGVRTAGAALALGTRHGVELPITAQMHEVLTARIDPRSGVEQLMLRPQRAEADTG